MDSNALINLLPIVGMVIAGYFLIIRPQSERQKKHQATLAAMKRNDTVVLNSGVIGKVTRIEDAEVMVEVAAGVNIRVVKALITEVRTKGDPTPANDKAA